METFDEERVSGRKVVYVYEIEIEREREREINHYDNTKPDQTEVKKKALSNIIALTRTAIKLSRVLHGQPQWLRKGWSGFV